MAEEEGRGRAEQARLRDMVTLSVCSPAAENGGGGLCVLREEVPGKMQQRRGGARGQKRAAGLQGRKKKLPHLKRVPPSDPEAQPKAQPCLRNRGLRLGKREQPERTRRVPENM